MALLNSYNDFIDRVNELGFMALSNIHEGFPSLSSETSKNQWHTGEAETDPWQWKDRAAEEKKLAFGCILGGNKGFISEKMYQYFYSVYKPTLSMEERWEEGMISTELWNLWQLFNKKTLLDTAEIRKEMGVTAKSGGSKLDRAVVQLQREYYITVAGNRYKINKQGEPYGWPANTYDKVENWVPSGWIENSSNTDVEEARQTIINTGLVMCKGLDKNQFIRILSLK